MVKVKVEVVYTSKCKMSKSLAEYLAKEARTYAKELSDYDFNHDVDLLVIGFEEYVCLKDKELEEFISHLSRQHVKNIALFNLFFVSNKQMERIIQLCHQYDLPLMRETYSCKIKPFCNHGLCDDALSSARSYLEDMMTICHQIGRASCRERVLRLV